MINAWLPLQHLDRPLLTGADGLCYFYFTPIENVLLWPSIDPLTASFTDNIILKEGKTWYRCKVIEKGRALSIDQKTSGSGSYFDISVTGFLPWNNAQIDYTANQLKTGQFVLVLKERTGIMRLMGNMYSGADVAQSYSTNDISGSAGRTITFSWQSEDSLPLFQTPVISEVGTVIPPWIPPPPSKGDILSYAVQVNGVDGQSDYIVPELVGNDLLFLVAPPAILATGALENQYTFDKPTGTVHFNYPLSSEQIFAAVYNNLGAIDDATVVSKAVQFAGVDGQSDYVIAALVDKDIVFVAVPPDVKATGALENQYTYDKATGKIHFNYPLTSDQFGIAIYNDTL